MAKVVLLHNLTGAGQSSSVASIRTHILKVHASGKYIDMDYDCGYDMGWRYGTFDKCNGKPYTARWASDDNHPFTVGFQDGYQDAYDSNDVRIAA